MCKCDNQGLVHNSQYRKYTRDGEADGGDDAQDYGDLDQWAEDKVGGVFDLPG